MGFPSGSSQWGLWNPEGENTTDNCHVSLEKRKIWGVLDLMDFARKKLISIRGWAHLISMKKCHGIFTWEKSWMFEDTKILLGNQNLKRGPAWPVKWVGLHIHTKHRIGRQNYCSDFQTIRMKTPTHKLATLDVSGAQNHTFSSAVCPPGTSERSSRSWTAGCRRCWICIAKNSRHQSKAMSVRHFNGPWSAK